MSKNIEFQFKNPEDSPGYLLAHLTMLWQRKQKKVLDPLDLTHTQFVLLASLAWLSKTNNAITQVDIANQGNADRMMVSKVLRTLEKKDFIKRKEHDTDTRAKVVTMTSKGAKVFQIALKNVETFDKQFFSPLAANLSSFNTNMEKLIKINDIE